MISPRRLPIALVCLGISLCIGWGCVPKPSPNLLGIITIAGSQAAQTETVFRVVSSSPSNNDTNVPVFSSITITFSRDVNASTLPNAITFTQPTGSTRIRTLSQTTQGRLVTLRPDNSFEANGTYSITVRNTLQDSTGQALQSNFTFSFTTAR